MRLTCNSSLGHLFTKFNPFLVDVLFSTLSCLVTLLFRFVHRRRRVFFGTLEIFGGKEIYFT